MRSIVIASFLVLTLAQAPVVAQPRSAAKDHAIHGQIVDDLSGHPITDVELVLNSSTWEPAAEPVAPDSEGRFTFDGLAPGEYTLRADRPDFGTIYFGELPDPGWIQTIHLEPDEREKVIVFRLIPRSAVTGIVRDEFGDPVVGAMVSLSRPLWSDGKITRSRVNQVTTDDRGKYRISRVLPGSYQVCATDSFGKNVAVLSQNQADYLSPSVPWQHVRTCYPGSGESARSAFRIAAGQHAVVDLTIASAPATRIRGRVVGITNLGANIRLIRVDPPEGEEFVGQADVDFAKGTFEFHGVLPGRYRIDAEIGSRNGDGKQVDLRVSRPIIVGTSNLDDIELKPEGRADLQVVLHAAEGGTVKMGAVSLGLRTTPPSPSGDRFADVGEGNSLRFSALLPGVYWIVTRSTLNSAEDGFCIQSVKLDGQELLHGSLAVTPEMNARIDVIVSKHCGVIRGRVISKGKPVPDAKVVLLLSGSAEEPGDMVTNFTDDRGVFSFSGLPFGGYRLWAWKVNENAWFFGPASLAGEEKLATAVSVISDEPVVADVELVPAEGQSR